jgi:hypothetical protein
LLLHSSRQQIAKHPESSIYANVPYPNLPKTDNFFSAKLAYSSVFAFLSADAFQTPSFSQFQETYPGTQACNTFDVCACREEAAFACDYGEDCVWVRVEVAQSGNGVGNEGAAEGIEGFGAVELLGC